MTLSDLAASRQSYYYLSYVTGFTNSKGEYVSVAKLPKAPEVKPDTPHLDRLLSGEKLDVLETRQATLEYRRAANAHLLYLMA